MEPRSRSPSAFASTMEAAWGFCLSPSRGGPWHPSVSVLAQPPSIWGCPCFPPSTPTLRWHWEHRSFHLCTALRGLWHPSLPLQVLGYSTANSPSTGLSAVSVLDSLPKACTVLRAGCCPDCRVAPAALHRSPGSGWRAGFHAALHTLCPPWDFLEVGPSVLPFSHLTQLDTEVENHRSSRNLSLN